MVDVTHSSYSCGTNPEWSRGQAEHLAGLLLIILCCQAPSTPLFTYGLQQTETSGLQLIFARRCHWFCQRKPDLQIWNYVGVRRTVKTKVYWTYKYVKKILFCAVTKTQLNIKLSLLQHCNNMFRPKLSAIFRLYMKPI